ncbi:MAG: DUF4114 domain-containing protein, partial [candidate division Zixibacteria bacterium]|nr:DUF4114 domain-containing protein [candidate division Zixibacteria bacterium]
MRIANFWCAALLALLLLAVCAPVTSAQTKEPWADSISAKTPAAEHPLQYYFDSLGYDIDVANDELGLETFCGLPGLNAATMVIEVAGSAVYAVSGYYAAGDTSVFYQLFGPTDGPGDSVQFSIGLGDSIAFYMKPNLPGDENTWLSETSLNWDNYDHAWVFATSVPHEYLIAFEDLPNGGDADYNDLVIRIRFANQTPEVVLPEDSTIISCDLGQVCFDVGAIDGNCQGDSIWLEMLSGEGTFTTVAGLSSIAATHCFTPTASGTYVFTFRVEDQLGASDVESVTIDIQMGAAPVVTVNDTTVALCSPDSICLPVEIIDADCDVISVTTNVGAYSGTVAGYDQVARINALGGTITQIGGGAPGQVLYAASDFVPPVNSQSGVAVTLPNFTFADEIVQYGSFPNGTEPGNSADHLLGAPTDLTFTTPGAGGPDGGSGDGSVAFSTGNKCTIGFDEYITTCNGASVDFIVFTNTAGGGSAELRFRKDGATVHTVTRTLPGDAVGSGVGGVNYDLPDGLTFNEVRIRCQSGSLEIDAFAARTAPSTTTEDICFYAATAGFYDVIVTVEDGCGNIVADTATVTVALNVAPVADAGANQTLFVCTFSEICLPVSFSDPDGNLAITEKTSGPGTLSGGSICFTPTSAGVHTFVIHAVDDCGLQDYDTVVVTIQDNDAPVAANPSPVTRFLCEPTQLCHNFTATDANGGTLFWIHLAGAGSITTAGQFCFTPTTSGTYNASVAVLDSCGAADTTSITYHVTLNSAPVAVDPPSPVDRFQCTAEEICFQFAADDSDGGTLTWTMLSGVGTLNAAGLWCFTPGATGSYPVQVIVTDSCGLADTTGKTFEVTVNEPPTVTLGPDTAVTQCTPEAICIEYTVDDPQGLVGITESMISGYGAIDTAANQICFTPTAAGTYEFVVKVQDGCGALAKDTMVVTVTFGDVAAIDCPTGPLAVSLCAADSVCQMLDITPSGATVTVSHGVYDAGQLCFYADTSGSYEITVIAEALCSADTCELVFNVEIG